MTLLLARNALFRLNKSRSRYPISFAKHKNEDEVDMPTSNANNNNLSVYYSHPNRK